MKTRQLKLVQTLTLATCVALTLAARADDYPPKAHHEELNAKLTGAHFVHKASMAGMKDIKLGKVAQDRAENAEVKTFASRLVMDHRQANDRLATLAKQKGISLPD
ncbi:MAG TPA: DUF4142 domain-containing protein, partial [Opitutales bacterium]|nr:DUF4142 domain-containing protein [Opitutales bacterium]